MSIDATSRVRIIVPLLIAAFLAALFAVAVPPAAHAELVSGTIQSVVENGHYTDSITEAEDNDEITAANNVALNQWVYGTYGQLKDVDYFVTSVPKAGQYTLSFVNDTVDASGSWSVKVFDNDRGPILSKTPSASHIYNQAYNIQLPAGSAWIMVQRNNSSLPLGCAYHVRLSEAGYKATDTTYTAGYGAAVQNEIEPNDSIETANKVEMAQYVYGNYSQSRDNDIYVMTAPTTGLYTFSFVGDTTNGSGSWHIYVYDLDRNKILDKTYSASKVSRQDWDIELPAGTAYVHVARNTSSLQLGYSYHLRLTTNLKAAVVTGVKNKIYTGKPQAQSGYTVQLAGQTLREGIDYKVSYKENTNAGTATMVVEGIGAYTGTVNKAFTIKQRAIKKASFNKISAKKYTGSYIRPKVVAKYNGKKLAENTDFTTSYSNNYRPGKAKVTITGKGNFKGTKTLTFKIK